MLTVMKDHEQRQKPLRHVSPASPKNDGLVLPNLSGTSRDIFHCFAFWGYFVPILADKEAKK